MGPSPIESVDNYRYYVVSIDDFSHFTWFYPLKTKTGFYHVLTIFLKFVQTHFDQKVKIFQNDGGSEFVNDQTVQKVFEDNETFHRFSCPYTPKQNGRFERKHRHLVETGLVMLFNSYVPTICWFDVFSSATYIIRILPTPVLDNRTPFELLYSQIPTYTNFWVFGC